jgi:23S rRNA pseudouridine1911/1915/1917 synthase
VLSCSTMNSPLDTFTVTAQPSDNKVRLDKFLSHSIDTLTRSRIQTLIQESAVLINGEAITNCSHKIKKDDEVTLTIPEIKEATMAPAPDIVLDVAFEDEHLLVINKQAGLTVHPGAGTHVDTLAHALLAHCGDSLSGIGGVQRPGIVHRLDRDTTGLMVVAKHDIAHVDLSEKIQTRELKRTYNAIVWGAPFPPVGKIQTYIDRSKKDRTKMVATKGTGKHAVTNFKVLEVFGNNIASLVECRLETGRTHQIRVHMQYKGFPIVGDTTYGQTNKTKGFLDLPIEIQHALKRFPRQALHSSRIAFDHPVTGEHIERESYPADGHPADMAKLIETLRTLG